MSGDLNPIRILSVDDHPLIRQGVAGLVATQADMNLIAQAANGREAIQQFHRHRPDITLMDLQMPEMNGLDAIIAIRGEFPEARIIVLTTYAGDVQALRAIKAGARAYPPARLGLASCQRVRYRTVTPKVRGSPTTHWSKPKALRS